MGWLKLLLGAAGSILRFLEQRQLITAGEMKAYHTMSGKALKRAEKAKKMRHTSRNKRITDQLLRRPKERE